MKLTQAYAQSSAQAREHEWVDIMPAMPSPLLPLSDVEEAFAFLDDWEDRYRYIMDLGAKLPALADEDRIEQNLVHGCQSAVWVAMHGDDGNIRLTADSESQIVKALKEVEGGRNVKVICREYGISEATYYNWKSKYFGMMASDIKKLKELEDENCRLKLQIKTDVC